MKHNNVDIIIKILWLCVIILICLIGIRLFQYTMTTNSGNNVKDVLMNKTLPALQDTEKAIFPEQSQSEDMEF